MFGGKIGPLNSAILLCRFSSSNTDMGVLCGRAVEYIYNNTVDKSKLRDVQVASALAESRLDPRFAAKRTLKVRRVSFEEVATLF